MFQPLHTGAQGLYAQQKHLDTIGNNIANVQTSGYKSTRLDFQDNLYTRMWNYADPEKSPDMNLQRGTGVRTYQTAVDDAQGAFLESGRLLDFALEGRGYFVFENPDPGKIPLGQDDEELPNFLYGRDGTFYLSPDPENPEQGYLVDARGRYVLDDSEERILITSENFTVEPDGSIIQEDADGIPTLVAKLMIVDFTNPGGLEPQGGNVFMQGANSGEEIEAAPVVRNGFLESSNVDLSFEMTRMIRAQRSYQLASRVVSTADQMLAVANQIRS